MSAPLCNTCGEALSTLSHPPSGQERDCPERKTEMAEMREEVDWALETVAEHICQHEAGYEDAWEALDIIRDRLSSL